MRLIVLIYSPLEALRLWGKGCRCHESDRIAGRDVDCIFGGRRLTEAHGKIKETKGNLVTLADNILVAHPWVTNLGFFVEFDLVIRQVLGKTEAKFECLDLLPYCLVRIHEPGIADYCLMRHDAMVAAGERNRMSLTIGPYV